MFGSKVFWVFGNSMVKYPLPTKDKCSYDVQKFKYSSQNKFFIQKQTTGKWETFSGCCIWIWVHHNCTSLFPVWHRTGHFYLNVFVRSDFVSWSFSKISKPFWMWKLKFMRLFDTLPSSLCRIKVAPWLL